MITAYLNNSVAVSNHAHSGLTTETFRHQNHYSIIERYIRPGDYCFFQFGHNDQKCPNLQAYGGYKENLVRYVKEIRAKGAFPLILTPIARNTWKGSDGTYNDLLKDNAAVCIQLGKDMDVPVVDLHTVSMEWIKKTGRDPASAFYYPNDSTHSNDYGGYLAAGMVAWELKRVCAKWPTYQLIANSITEGFGDWLPPEDIAFAPKPERLKDVAAPYPEGELLSYVVHLDEKADRASVLDMVVRTSHFVPVNVYNDRYDDITGHESVYYRY